MTEKEVFYRLAWAHGEVTVRAVGGMIAPVEFDLGGGHRISPLHVAPWKPDGLSPLMAGLRGEWPCLPFGPARVPENLPPDWLGRKLEKRTGLHLQAGVPLHIAYRLSARAL